MNTDLPNQPKPAPTAEEQLPPTEQAMQAIADIEALLRDATWPNITEQNRIICAKQALDVYVPIARAAALRSNREKDAQLAELTEDVRLAKYERNQYDAAHRREVVNVLKLSAQLRAVSEALKGKFEIEFGEDFVPRYRTFHVDAVFDDLRSIVDGKE